MFDLSFASALPIIEHDTLFHVGEMDGPPLPRYTLYKAPGLFVSPCPDAWAQIAGLSGATWEFRREDSRPGKFLNILALGSQRVALLTEAVRLGWLTPTTTFRWDYHDSEFDEPRFVLFWTEAEAITEADGETDAISAVPGFLPTPNFLVHWRRCVGEVAVSPADTEEFAMQILVAKHTDLDGVWWDERFDPPNLSAPQGVIFEGRLPHWARREIIHVP